MASYWRELRDCESDKALVRAGLAYYDAGNGLHYEADRWWAASARRWEYAIKHRRLWVLVEKDDSPTTGGTSNGEQVRTSNRL
jgi:hypothetical protein